MKAFLLCLALVTRGLSYQAEPDISPACCPKKKVNGLIYNLVDFRTIPWDECLNGCIYQQGNSEERVCFGPGTFSPQCLALPCQQQREVTCHLSIRDSQTNEPLPGPIVIEGEPSNFEINGTTLVFNSFGTFQIRISSPDYISTVLELDISPDTDSCNRLVPLSRATFDESSAANETGLPQTRIITTWGNVFDIDTHVMAIPNNYSGAGEECRTYFGNRNSCPGISQDWDNTGLGIDGPETVTLQDVQTNSDYVYVIAVMHYPRKLLDFAASETTVRIENAVQSQTFELPKDYIPIPAIQSYDYYSSSGSGSGSGMDYFIPYVNGWWYLGCLRIDESTGRFSIITPNPPHFADGDTSDFIEFAIAFCGIPNVVARSRDEDFVPCPNKTDPICKYDHLTGEFDKEACPCQEEY